MKDWHRGAGFTLIELMVIVIVLAVTLSLAVPAIQEMLKNNRVTGQTNEMLSLVAFARNEAIRRNDSVTLQIQQMGTGWSAEVVDPSGDGTAQCGPGALRCATHTRVEIDLPEGSSSIGFVFNSRGYLEPFAEREFAMQHVDCQANQFQRRLVILRPTGQVESCRAACGSNTCE